MAGQTVPGPPPQPWQSPRSVEQRMSLPQSLLEEQRVAGGVGSFFTQVPQQAVSQGPLGAQLGFMPHLPSSVVQTRPAPQSLLLMQPRSLGAGTQAARGG